MRIVSVNVGHAEPVGRGRDAALSGIRKRPAVGSVSIDAAGVAHDAICDGQHHGGADQAVYAYGVADYAWWSKRLNREIAPGTFGENLTIDGLPVDLHAGDRLAAGDLILEATAPRIPCGTLAAQMDDRGFALRFRRAERPGFYFRVLRPGAVAAGMPVTCDETGNGNISMLELFRLSYAITPSAGELRRALAAPIAARMRDNLEKQLAAADNLAE